MEADFACPFKLTEIEKRVSVERENITARTKKFS
tara:strand:- start:109523 stop:109624 length:102 start_codon:yes stop_codon:yes gene_type:complete